MDASHDIAGLHDIACDLAALYFVPLLAGIAVGTAGFRIVSSDMYTRTVLAITFTSPVCVAEKFEKWKALSSSN